MPSLLGTVASSQLAAVTPEWATAWADAWDRQAAGGGQAHIVCFGDSTTIGYTATEPFWQNSWAGRLPTLFASNTGVTPGTGYVRQREPAIITDARITVSGSWINDSNNGLYNNIRYTETGSTAFTTTCSSFRVMYVQVPSGSQTFTWSVDGGATTSVNASGTGPAVITIPAGSPGVHTLTLTRTAGLLFPIAVEGILNPTSGVKVSRLGLGSQRSVDLNNNAFPSSSYNCSRLTDPDLVIVSFSMAEAILGYSQATSDTQHLSIINDFKAKGASVVLLCSIPANVANVSEATWNARRAATQALAEANDCGFIDCAAIGSHASNPTYIDPDGVHPSNLGHTLMASYIRDQLLAVVA
jgi:lysophospholipase L1-like esterase